MRRHDVLPGITGLAQVNGRNANTWEDTFDLDVEYVENLSFKLDCKILWSTIKNVLVSKDIEVAPPGEYLDVVRTKKYR